MKMMLASKLKKLSVTTDTEETRNLKSYQTKTVGWTY